MELTIFLTFFMELDLGRFWLIIGHIRDSKNKLQ